MVKYICELCKYNTTRKTEYSRHISTNKHLQKVTDGTNDTQSIPKVYPNNTTKKSRIYKCIHCHNTFSNASSLGRHKKTCADSKLKDNEVVALKKENERIQKEAKEKEEILRKQLDTYEQLLKSMTSPQTINYFNYITTNYPNAPALESQKCYKNLLESKVSTLVDIITMYYYDNKLVNFIGDYLIKVYTHKEPKKQSIWTTDISRLTYIISQKTCLNNSLKESTKNNKNVNIWSYDKKGSKTKKIMIEPVLQYIRDQLFKYCQVNGGNSKASVLKKLIAANEVIQIIDNGELLDKINKYIAPEFSVKHGDEKNTLIKV